MLILKSASEIAYLKAAGRIAAETLKKTGEAVKPGIKTSELDRFANSLIEKAGAVSAFKGYRGYPANICISINEEVVHGIPSDRKIKEGDIVSLDVGVIKDGFFGDVAGTFPAGEISSEAEKLLRTAEECLEDSIAQVKPDARMGDVAWAVQSKAEQNGYSVVRDFTGHGIGRSLHEDLQVPNFGKPGTGVRLREGMTFCIEPMLNAGVYNVTVGSDGWTVTTKDKKLSAHFEAAVAVVKGGVDVLTAL